MASRLRQGTTGSRRHDALAAAKSKFFRQSNLEILGPRPACEPRLQNCAGRFGAVVFSPNASLLLQRNRAVCPVKKKLRILAVDDEPIIGESIAYVLEAPHRKIAVARDGLEALTMAAKEKYDVVITDHRMPRSGGLELVKKLRQRDYTGKIVVLSAYLSPEHIGTYEELKVDEIVSKPFDSAELREVIAGLEEELELL